MNFRVEIVDPTKFVAAASQVLTASWTPPCLRYSPEYLRWQFEFPGELPPRLVIAFADREAVGCVAVTPRIVRRGEDVHPVYILSFAATVPAARGHGLGAVMYNRLLTELPVSVEVIAFAESASAGERLLLRAFTDASFNSRRLESCRAFGYLPRPSGDPSAATPQTGVASHAQFVEAVANCGRPADMLNYPSAPEWSHYLTDPRGRDAVALLDRAGVPLASAMIVEAEVISAQGLSRVRMLENISVCEHAEESLKSLLTFASERRRNPVDPVVIASNVSFLNPAAMKTVGARALPSVFNAYIFSRESSIPNVTCTNLEVI